MRKLFWLSLIALMNYQLTQKYKRPFCEYTETRKWVHIVTNTKPKRCIHVVRSAPANRDC